MSTVAAAMVLSGCLGASSRADFERMVQERGGGVSAATLDVMLADIRARTGSDDPSIRFGRINFGVNTAVFEVRSPARPNELDAYTYRNEQFVSVEPVRLTRDDDLDVETIPLSSLRLDVEALSDRALAEFDSTGGYVTGLSIIVFIPPGGIRVDVESPRSSGTAIFGPDGTFLEFDR